MIYSELKMLRQNSQDFAVALCKLQQRLDALGAKKAAQKQVSNSTENRVTIDYRTNS